MTTERREDDGAERINRHRPYARIGDGFAGGDRVFARHSDWRETENLPTAKEIGGGEGGLIPLFLIFSLFLHVRAF